MHQTKKNTLRFVFALVCLLSACTNFVVFEQDLPLPNQSWSMDRAARFKVPITDTSDVCNLFIKLKNNNDYLNSNIWLFVSTQSPSGHTRTDTLEYAMANYQGKWLGQKAGGMQHFVPFKTGVKFTETGDYEFHVLQGMRHEALQGISEVGFLVEKVDVQAN